MVRGIGGHYKAGVAPFRSRKRAASFVAHAYSADISKAQTRRMFIAQGGRQYYFERLWTAKRNDAKATADRNEHRKQILTYGQEATPFGGKGYQRLMRLGFSARYSASFRALEMIREYYPEAGRETEEEGEE